MSLSDQARHYMDQRGNLSTDERYIVNYMMDELYQAAMIKAVKAAKNDKAAELEAAIIKFIIESREG